MAVSVQTPLYSKLGMWNSGDPPTVYTSTGSDAVSGTMAYQYPLPSSGLDQSTNMIPSFHHLPSDHPPPHSPAHTKPSSPDSQNRGPSSLGSKSSSKASKIKRSMSTPNVRGQATADAAALALSAEKRRNKLGYHRTSVACGHCRRRKIRCIPAPADPQNRCSNCIRLKKECNFYPVDQQPPPDPRRRNSKAQSGTGRASESSSPSTSSGQLPEMPPTLPYPHLNMPPIQDLGGPQMKRQRTESFSPENRGMAFSPQFLSSRSDNIPVVTSSRNFDYNHGTNWMASDASPSTTKPSEVPQSFWRVNPQDSPVTPAFSPFTPNLQIPPPQNWPPHTEASPRDELSWGSVPQRSISYSNIEGLQTQHQYAPFPHPPSQQVGDHYTTKPRLVNSGMYPPPISTSGSAISAPETTSTTHEPSPQSHSTGSLPPTSYQSWQQPYSYQKPAGSSAESYGAWNAPHGGQQHLPEVGGHGGQTSYAYGEPQSGMYYPPPPHAGR